MKALLVAALSLAIAAPLFSQQAIEPVRPAASTTEGANLPVERIGPNDLIGVAVYDAPELSRSVRVEGDGSIRLPMVKQRIPAGGLFPSDLEKSIAAVLIGENVLVNPVVTVTVQEYRSRTITVAGAVRSPVTFQATGNVTLLDALSRAGGIGENAGPSVLVSRRPAPDSGAKTLATRRIPVHELLAGDDPSLNLSLEGGEEIRVPEAGKIFVTGNVKKPGVYAIADGNESSVLKALALSEGLANFSSHTAYIYRTEAGGAARNEIPVDLKRILDRKSPDMPLYPNDMLYVPDSPGRRASAKVLESTLGVGVGLASIILLASQ